MDETLYKWVYIIYVYILIVIKIVYLVTLITVKVQKDPNETILNINDISKNMVMGMLAILMIYIFHPKRLGAIIVRGETKFLMFLFGVISLLDIPWSYPFEKIITKNKLGITQDHLSLGLGIVITSIVTGLVYINN